MLSYYFHLNLLLVVSEMADMNTECDVQGSMCMTEELSCLDGQVQVARKRWTQKQGDDGHD